MQMVEKCVYPDIVPPFCLPVLLALAPRPQTHARARTRSVFCKNLTPRLLLFALARFYSEKTVRAKRGGAGKRARRFDRIIRPLRE